MKESRFNEYFTASDSAKLAFNSLTCALAVVDDTYTRLIGMLDGLTAESVPAGLKECYDAAVLGHFIVSDDADELLELSTKRNIQKYSTQSLGLTIAPTMACNFKCVYCYEERKQGMMSGATQSGIIDFVKQQAQNIKRLDITWYGGEPLLAKDVVYHLSQEFMAVCAEKGIDYSAFIVSNASLLDADTIQHLIDYNVKGIQITVDGPPAVHDARRISRNGESTFDLIVRNINALLSTGEIRVVLRVNVDKTNDDDVESLVKILSERLVSHDVAITFGQVTAYTKVCKGIETSCYGNGEFAMQLLKYYGLLQQYGFGGSNKFPYPKAKLNYCCAEYLNSFVVDHEGYVYKCWNEVGRIERALGNMTGGKFDISCAKNGVWMARNPIAAEKCQECSLLPVCMGGCPYNDMVQGVGNVCGHERYNLKDTMLRYYDAAKGGK